MRKFIGVALIAWLLTGTGLIFGQVSRPPVNPAPHEWRTYVQPAAGFAVSSPVALNLTATQSRVSPFGGKGMTLKVSTFFGFLPSLSNSSPMLLLATVMEPVTEKALLNLTPEERAALLNRLPEELAGSGGKVIRRQAIRFNGYPGRDFIVQFEGGPAGDQTVGRAFLIGDRVIGIYFWKPAEYGKTPEISRFFDSFRLMTAEEKHLYGTANTTEMIEVNDTGQGGSPKTSF